MTDDLETLRRHERSLRGLLRSQPNHTRDPFVEALQWSLARVREAIAKAEADAELARARESQCQASFCVNGVVYPRSKDGGGPGAPCPVCKGTGMPLPEVPR
jgi:hypothetical protein